MIDQRLMAGLQLSFLGVMAGMALRRYKNTSVPWYISGLAWLSVMISVGIMLILPYDVYYSSLNLPEVHHSLALFWKTCFVFQLLLSFVVLPFFQEYKDSGEFDVLPKMKDSIRINLKIYLYAILVIMGIWLGFLVTGNLLLRDTPAFMAALANCFGLTIIVLLMGYGLVQIPRDFLALTKGITDESQAFQAMYEMDETSQDLEMELHDLTAEIIYIEPVVKKQGDSTARRYSRQLMAKLGDKYIKEVLEMESATQKDTHLQKIHSVLGLNPTLAQFHKYLVKLHYRLNKLKQKTDRVQHRLEQHALNIHSYQSGPNIRAWRSVLRGVALLLGLASLIIISLEVSNLGNYSLSLDFQNENLFLGLHLMTLLFMSYMYAAVFKGLFALKIEGLYGLYPDKQTDSASLMFFSINFLRVSFPLCLNFLQMAKISRCQFIMTLGNLDNVPLFGTQYPLIFPAVLVVLVVFNLFDLYGRLMGCLGLKNTFTYSLRDQTGVEKGRGVYQRVLRSLDTMTPSHDSGKLLQMGTGAKLCQV